MARRDKNAPKSRVVCALDVGTSKICCIIARLEPRDAGQVMAGRKNAVTVMGFGHTRSAGIKSGVVVDMDSAEEAIRNAIDTAERSAGVTVDSVTLAVSAGRLSSDTFSSSISLDGREVSKSDIRTVLAAGCDHAARGDRTTLHALAIGYSLDSEHGIDDPIAMAGKELGVDMHVVSADSAPVRNLESCINRSHLAIDGMVAAPYASGLSALVDDEARVGAACIDFGAGTTSLSVFLNNRMVFADSIAVGGQHATMDLARVLSVRVDDAERLKVLHAHCDAGRVSGNDTVPVAHMADDTLSKPSNVSLVQVARIVAPRIEETVELIRDRLARSGFAGAVGKRIVVTGGGSQLPGLPEMVSKVLGTDARHGRPLGISGLPSNAKGPAFAAAAGLLVHPEVAHLDHASRHNGGNGMISSSLQSLGLSRVGAWFRASL